jgi:hypothetical protein
LAAIIPIILFINGVVIFDVIMLLIDMMEVSQNNITTAAVWPNPANPATARS